MATSFRLTRKQRWQEIYRLGLSRIEGKLSARELDAELEKIFAPEPELPLGNLPRREDA